MMLRDSFTKWLWDSRRSLLVWTLAIVVIGGTYAAFWPTIDDPAMQEAIANYPEGLLEALNYTDITTAAGYLDATVYGLLAAVLLVVYSAAAGARSIAGDEEAETLDLVLAHPVSRRRLALQRFAAFAVSVVLIAVALLVVLLLLSRPVGLDDISLAGFGAMTLHLVAFTWVFGALAFAVGAATGRRAPALGVAAALAVFGFVANGILPQVDGLAWTEALSPFEWLNGETPLRNGAQWDDLALMAALSVGLVAAGTAVFERRDIGV